MKYRKILIEYNLYLKKLYFTSEYVIKVLVKYKILLLLTGKIGCRPLSPLTILSSFKISKRI